MNNKRDMPMIAVTMGDINGIGPEILAKAFARGEICRECRPVIFGSPGVYDRVREACSAPEAVPVRSIEEARGIEDALPFLDCGAVVPPYRPGVLDPDAGRSAMTWLEAAVDHAIAGTVSAIVTCPINKQGIHRAGYTNQGHTDYIAERTGSPDYRMCLFAGPMRIVHITGHMSLRQALDRVRAPRIAESVRIGHRALQRLGMARPRIAVAGLNPHAGEAGAFGDEERREIRPAVEACINEGIDCTGPHSPDTVFLRMREGEFDMVIALYHDQGHIPLKLIAMDEGVNVTLGIPIVRTSVDHGTAYDIAGTGRAREYSLCAAIILAARMAACPGGSLP